MPIQKVSLKGSKIDPTGLIAARKARGVRLTRNEAAKFLGISKTELGRRESLGVYRAEYIDHRGWRLYDITTLREYKKNLVGRVFRKDIETFVQEKKVKEVVEIEPDTYHTKHTKEDAQLVFRELRDGHSLIQIVEEHCIHPKAVRVLHNEWLDLHDTAEGGGLYIPRSILEEINKLPLEGTFPIASAENLLENLKEIVDATDKCIACKRSKPALCLKCHEAQKFAS